MNLQIFQDSFLTFIAQRCPLPTRIKKKYLHTVATTNKKKGGNVTNFGINKLTLVLTYFELNISQEMRQDLTFNQIIKNYSTSNKLSLITLRFCNFSCGRFSTEDQNLTFESSSGSTHLRYLLISTVIDFVYDFTI